MITDEILSHIFYLAIVLHVLAGVLTLAFVIPLQVQQVGVKNGLAHLRKQLLVKGVLSLIVIIFSILALTGRHFLPDGTVRTAMVLFVLSHALGILGKTWIDYKIYHQQYSEESKEMHELIEQIETGKAKVVQRHK